MGSVHRRAHSASSFRLALAIGSLLALASSLVPGLRGQTAPQTDGPGVEYAPDEILVRFKRDSTAPDRAQARAATGIRTFREFRSVERLQLLKLPTGTSVGDAIEYYARQPNVAYAEPNYRVRALVEPGDTRFGELWGLHSSTDVDIDAPEAWDLTTGSQAVVVGIIDTGIDYTHPDLVNNLFRNPLDCDADGVDDDGNGYVDDCFGIDAYNRDADPFDDNAHGTHVAGTIGASGDNGLGVVGVNWHVQLAACKFLGSSGSGSVSGAIECLDYFKALHDSGVAIVATSNSWGGGGYSQSLADAIAAHLDRGILFVAAAGNDSNDNDLAPAYPASYRLPNVISVAATTSADARASFSNFGQRSVHLAAPGAAILSTTPGNGYSSFSGTSMATPHVSGVAALLRAHQPSRDWRAIKNLLLAGGEAVAGGAGTITRRRLNAFGSLACSDATVFSRLEPMTSSIAVSSGSSVTLSALHIRCADPAGPVTVAIEPGGAVVTLHDDGVAPDTVSGDGLYAGAFTPGGPGPFTLTFPDGDTVTVVTVVGYAVEPTTYTYRTITGESLQLGDDSSAEIAAPFPIRLGGASFDRLFVNSNGNITFSGAYQAYVNQPLPALAAGIIVAPFWDDLTPASGTSQNVYWAVTGTAPNRELVVEWRDLPPYACRAEAASTVTFQVVFDEGSDRVLFNYADVIVGGGCSDNDRGGSATVGIQIASDYATEFSFGAQSLDDATALAWTVPGSCRLTLSSDSESFGAGGGTGLVNVTTVGTGCAWSATSQAAWIAISSGATGTGDGVVSYTVAPNPAGAPRSSTLSIGGGQTIVTQAAASLTLDTVYPSAGDIYGGTKVTLVGSGFRLGTPVTVFLGGVPCTNVRVVDDTTVSCVAGPLARARPERGAITRAAVDVVVTAGSLTAVKSNGYTYVTASSDATSDTDADGMSDDWERRYSLDFLSASDQTADPDGDGKSNLQEYAEGGHPRGFHTRYFAEGAVGDFFDTRFALLNAQTEPARVLLRFIRPDGGHVSHDLLLDGMTRASVDPETLPALTEAEFSTVVESDVPVIADRQMSWDASGYGSHAETSVTAPATTWYLAEGATHSGFSLFYLLQNPGDSVSEVQVAYLRPAPAVPLSRTYTIPPRSRRNIWVNLEDPALADTDVSAVITSTNGVPIIVERAMYLDGRGQRFDAGHESAGVTAPGTEWYLAEGATGSYFDLFVLVANPHPTQATITATYLVPSGPPIVKTYTVGPRSRYSIWVDQEDPRLAETAVSTIVRSTNGVGVVVERSMWWPGSAASWHEAHNSAGVGRAGSRWALAEGEIGGPNAQETYVLIANTANAPGLVRVTLVFEDGTTSARTFALAPTSRLNIDVASLFPEAASRRFGAVVESLGPSPVPIVVERAMYTTTNGVTWIAGTNAPATRIE